MYIYSFKLSFAKKRTTLNFDKCKDFIIEAINNVNEGIAFKRDNKNFQLQQIEKNFLYKNLTSEYLASVCGISKTRLARIFKKKFGLPIKKYIIQKKMNYACELLRLNRYSVAQIADMCNFSDVYFFSKQFKVYTGTTPTEYIKNAQF